ncbi:MAG TPA: tRNA-intron lyase [Candidatus Lokiarchaeia archaeon]|nr:tRNA-intron lyase [Candidatus Lokiarchaeia archaeon]
MSNENLSLTEKLTKIRRDLEPPFTAKLVGDEVIVFDHDQGSSLYAKGFYGKPLGIKKPDPKLSFDRELQLDLLEVVHLVKKGWLIVEDSQTGQQYTSDEIEEIAGRKYEKFMQRSLVYEDLRGKGYIVRPGLKFGADFTVYRQGPGLDHSAFVVLVLENENRISAMDMVRAGRLATSVKKRFVIASISSSESTLPTIVYYVFKWFKP